MKKLHFLTKNFVLIFVLALCTVQLSAQDKITLTWKVDDPTKEVRILTTPNENFTINWGDGTIETKTGEAISLLLKHTYTSGGDYEVVLASATSSCRLRGIEVFKQKVSTLNFSGCSELFWIDCDDNNIINLDHLSDLTALSYLSCSKNNISNLNIKGCSALRDLSCSSNQIKNLDLSTCSALELLGCGSNQITDLDLSNCPSLTFLYCPFNQITNLDLSTCSALEVLYCFNNKLSILDLSNCPEIWGLACVENQLQLSELYTLHLLIDNSYGKDLGTQRLPSIWTNINTELFADQSVFNGIYTQYVVEIGGKPAPENNYSVIDGKLTFHTLGKYKVTMTNSAIISRPDYPAEVIVTIDVVKLGVSENESLNIEVYPNPTTGELRVTISDNPISDIRLSDIEIFDIYGRNQKAESRKQKAEGEMEIDISHLAAGVYFVKIYTEAGFITKKIIKK